jgi:hypothetical protein
MGNLFIITLVWGAFIACAWMVIRTRKPSKRPELTVPLAIWLFVYTNICMLMGGYLYSVLNS